MALKVHDNGFVEIKTEKDALEALVRFRNLKAEIDEVRRENELDEMEKDAAAYKAAAQEFLVRSNTDHIQGDGWHGTIVKGAGASHWIATDDELTTDAPKRCKSLQSIIEKKFKGSVKQKGSEARKL